MWTDFRVTSARSGSATNTLIAHRRSDMVSSCVQDAHKAVQPKMQKGRKKKFGPLETKHTVTSVAWLPDSHVVASSGSPSCHTTALTKFVGAP